MAAGVGGGVNARIFTSSAGFSKGTLKNIREVNRLGNG